MSEVMIEVKNLKKRFEKGEALRGVSFSVCKGEICAAAGKAGSGKTTLTDLLTGVIEPDEGSISIMGVDMLERASEAKQHLGYAPAQPALYRDMTPRAGMKFIADAHGLSFREAGDKISAIIKRFAIKDIADTPVKSLSEGARRLVSLAQAVFMGAEVIVIDEPTAGLNPKEILEMRQIIRGLSKDHAILLTSANITELCAVADRVLLMDEGRIAAEGKSDELHRLAMNDGTLHLTLCGEENAVCKAMKSVENAELTELKQNVEGEYEVVMRVKDNTDIRAAAFKAVCENSLVLLGMSNGVKPVDALLMELAGERLALPEEKEEQGNEGDL